jgi:cytochrome c-type biogenesis protein CcmE
MKKRRIKLFASIALALAGVVFLSIQAAGAVTFSKMVHEIVADPGPWLAKSQVKVNGYVVAGSIETKVVDQETQRTFRIQTLGKEIHVRHRGPAADTFKDTAEAVVTGKLVEKDGELWLMALNGDAGLSAKCPSKYKGMDGAKAMQTLPPAIRE